MAEMQTIRLPNGDELKFPAGMSDDDIKAAINKAYPQLNPQTSEGGRAGLDAALDRMVENPRSPQNSLDFVMGRGRFSPVVDPSTGKPMKELGSNSPTTGSWTDVKMAAGMIVEADPKHRAEIIQKYIPDAQVEVTPQQDVIITLPDGQKRILNQRGLSLQDAAEVLTFAGKMAPVAKAGMAAKSIGGAALGAGAAAGALDLGLDKASGMLGSSREADIGKSAKEGALVGVFTFGSGALIKGLRTLASRGQLMASGGQLTPAARNALRSEGLSPDEITPEMARHLNVILRTAGNKADAIRLARYKSLKLDATPGDITQKAAVQAAEGKHIGVGVRGGIDSKGGEKLRAVKDAQAPQMQGAVGEVRRRITGDVGSSSAGVNMRKTVEGVRGAQEAEKRAVGALWDKAKSSGAEIDKAALKPLISDLRRSLTDFPAHKTAGIRTEIKAIQKFGAMKGVSRIKLKAIDDLRKRLGEFRKSADDTEAAAGSRAVKALERWADSLSDKAFAKGGKEGVTAYRTARKASADYSAKFRDDKTIRDMTGKTRMPDGSVVGRMTPSEAANKITTKTGEPKADAVQTVKRLKQIFGGDSKEFKGVQQAVIARIFKGDHGRFHTAFRKWTEEAPELAKALFSKRDLVQMANLAKAARDVTKKTAGTVNYSGSGYQRMRDKAVSIVPPWWRGAAGEGSAVLNRMGAGGEANALAARINKVDPVALGVTPGMAGYGLSQIPEMRAPALGLLPPY